MSSEHHVTPESFVAGLMQSVVDDNVSTYRELFANTLPDGASDPYWRRSLALYHMLTPDQQTVFFEIMRQVSVDTTANVLGVIDGVNFIEGGDEEFTLIYGQGRKISGDLQSLFLVEEEQRAGT